MFGDARTQEEIVKQVHKQGKLQKRRKKRRQKEQESDLHMSRSSEDENEIANDKANWDPHSEPENFSDGTYNTHPLPAFRSPLYTYDPLLHNAHKKKPQRT